MSTRIAAARWSVVAIAFLAGCSGRSSPGNTSPANSSPAAASLATTSSGGPARVNYASVSFRWSNTNEPQAKPSVDVEIGDRKDTIRLEEAGTPPSQNRLEWLRGKSSTLGVDVRAVRMGDDIRAISFLPNGLLRSQLIRGGQLVSDITQDVGQAFRCLITPVQERLRGDPAQPRRADFIANAPGPGSNGLGGLHTTYTFAPILTGNLAKAIAGTAGPIPLAALEHFTHTLINAANKILQDELAVTLVPVVIPNAYPSNVNQNNSNASVEGLADLAAQIASESGADLAHLISLGRGSIGWAAIGSACGPDFGRAATMGEGSDPVRYFDTFIHEVGHQLGAHHSFNGPGRSVFTGGYEPGAGLTVMSYQVSLQSFHAASLTQMFTYLHSQSCGTTTAVPQVPSLKATPATPYLVPKATAFALDAQPDATATCVRIDEYDAGAAVNSNPPFFTADTGCESSRTFPDEPRSISLLTLPAAVPATATSLHFRALVWSGTGGPRPLASSDFSVDVVDTTPFTVTSVTPVCQYAIGSKVQVGWQAAGILGAPFNVTKLNAELVYEDASLKPIVLGQDLPISPNNAVVDLPATANRGKARIKLAPVDGIYLAVSDWFTIQPASACTTNN